MKTDLASRSLRPETGVCACYLVPMPGYRSSDGYGNAGNRGDCGSANSASKYGGSIKACVGELACSGHGYCTNSPSFRCVCEDGWTSGDCSMREYRSMLHTCVSESDFLRSHERYRVTPVFVPLFLAACVSRNVSAGAVVVPPAVKRKYSS